MAYAEIDIDIARWAKRHRLVIQTGTPGDERRETYVSSVAGECFAIWIDPPGEGHVRIWAGGVDSRRDNQPPEDWHVPIEEFEGALEEVFHAVLAWMIPSERYFPRTPAP